MKIYKYFEFWIVFAAVGIIAVLNLVCFFSSHPQKYSGMVKIKINQLPGEIIGYNSMVPFYEIKYADKTGVVHENRFGENEIEEIK